MTFFVPTKSSGQEDNDTLIDVEKAQRIWVASTKDLEESHKEKGSHCLAIEVPHTEKNLFIYRYGSKEECESEMKKLNGKLKRREWVLTIIVPGTFTALGLALGLVIGVLIN